MSHHNCHVYDLSVCWTCGSSPRSAAPLNLKRLSCITMGMSVSCACGFSTVFRIWMSGTVSASWVRLHELCLRHLVSPTDRSQLCKMKWGLPLRRGSDFDGPVDELQLSDLPALSGQSAPVVSQRQVCHNCCSGAASVESPQCSVGTRVEDKTVDSSGASDVKRLILFSAWCTSFGRVLHPDVLYACVVISGSFRRRCLPAVGHALLPAVGPLFPALVFLFLSLLF